MIKTQTVVGWIVGMIAAIPINLLLETSLDYKFWVSVIFVLLVRVFFDLAFTFMERK